MQLREDAENPLFHLLLVSGLILLSFGVCHALQMLAPVDPHEIGRPPVHWVFLPQGMFVLLAWVYGWAMVPLVLPALLVSAAFIVGPEFMTMTVALLSVARLVTVMAAFEVLRMLGRDARGDHGRAGLTALFAGGLLSSAAFNVPRVLYGPCCEAMSVSERAVAYATAVGADLVGLMLVMLGAMFLFRLLRH